MNAYWQGAWKVRRTFSYSLRRDIHTGEDTRSSRRELLFEGEKDCQRNANALVFTIVKHNYDRYTIYSRTNNCPGYRSEDLVK